jgi:sulfur-oxidizing protein SoxY
MLARRTLVFAALPFAAIATRAGAQDAALRAAIAELVGEAEPQDGGVVLVLPERAENGGQVPVTVRVDNPMTEADHVAAIHLIATRNPTPGIASFRLTPLMARAEIQTRIRLAENQAVVALAQLNTGRVLRATAEARVVTGGCLT